MSATPALVAHLNSVGGQAPDLERDFYTITLQDGTRLYYGAADFPISAQDNSVWNPPAIDGSGGMWRAGLVWRPGIVSNGDGQTASWKLGLDTNGWALVVGPRDFDAITGAPTPDQINGVGWMEAAQAGALDGADVIVSTAYFASIPAFPPYSGVSPVGTLTTFRGTIGAVDVGDNEIYLAVTDYRYFTTLMMPRNLYQAGCRHRLYDERCTLSSVGFTRAAAAALASTPVAIVANADVAAPAGSATFALGVLTMTSGKNNGFKRLVTSWDGNRNFGLLAPFPFAVAAGDTFTVAAGCDKTQATCTAFGNLANFGGESYIPVPEVALG